MIHAFNPFGNDIIVSATLEGPARTMKLRMALDTGASVSLINSGMLIAVGYDPASNTFPYEITTASGIIQVTKLSVNRLSALGQTRFGLNVIAYNLPPSSGVDGLLGLDFFRGLELHIDFRFGQIELK